MTFRQCAAPVRGDRHDPRCGRAAAKPVAAIAAHALPSVGLVATEGETPYDKDPENRRRKNGPLQPIQHRQLLTQI